MTGIGREQPLRKMTSAAYGFSQDSLVEALAECCQARIFLRST